MSTSERRRRERPCRRRSEPLERAARQTRFGREKDTPSLALPARGLTPFDPIPRIHRDRGFRDGTVWLAGIPLETRASSASSSSDFGLRIFPARAN